MHTITHMISDCNVIFLLSFTFLDYSFSHSIIGLSHWDFFHLSSTTQCLWMGNDEANTGKAAPEKH